MVLRKLGALARRTNPGQARTYRLASSVRLPWLVGLILFLLLALAAALLVGRTGDEVQVPQAILDNQESITQSAAQSVRRSVNEGVDDLEAFSSIVESLDPGDGESLTDSLEGVAEVHGRYLTLYVVDDEGEILGTAGENEPVSKPLDLANPFERAGIDNAEQVGGTEVPVILQYAPLPEQDGRQRAIIGEYDPSFFRFPLGIADPGEVWLVNREGQVVGSPQGFTAFQELPRRPLREAAAQAADGGSGSTVVPGSLERQEIVSFAPVSGIGPAGSLGWSVVTARSVDSISLPETSARRQGIILAIIIALVTVVIFGWLYILVLRPLFKLQREAERLAYGDLSRNVEVVRYDEIGLISRALERIRVLLVRRRIQGDVKRDQTSQTESPAEKES